MVRQPALGCQSVAVSRFAPDNRQNVATEGQYCEIEPYQTSCPNACNAAGHPPHTCTISSSPEPAPEPVPEPVVPEDPCDSSPCLHEGACRANGDSYECSCVSSWTGPTCGDSDTAPEPVSTDPCDGVTCNGHGSCVAVFGGAECQCAQGFSNPDGNTLDCVAPPPPPPADPCDGVTCSGHGNCLATDGVATCACTSDGAYIYHHPEGNPLDCVSSSTPVGPEPGPGTLPAR